MDDIYFRNKVTVLQFCLSIAVIYQHTQLQGIHSTAITELKGLIFFLVEVAVPMFFLISGYLFFRTYRPEKALDKLKSRIHSLFVPYLIWNMEYAFFIILLIKLGLIGEEVSTSVERVLLGILNSDFSPLWYVKYIMVFSALSIPLFYLLKNKNSGLLLLISMVGFNIFFCYKGVLKSPLNVNENSVKMLNYQGIFFIIPVLMLQNVTVTGQQGHNSRPAKDTIPGQMLS